jgi:hypothetical protein
MSGNIFRGSTQRHINKVYVRIHYVEIAMSVTFFLNCTFIGTSRGRIRRKRYGNGPKKHKFLLKIIAQLRISKRFLLDR